MPIYEYLCTAGHRVELVQRFADEALTVCEVCGKPAQRVLHAPAVHFKGKGFYATDYGKRKGTNGDKADSGSPSESGSKEAAASSELGLGRQLGLEVGVQELGVQELGVPELGRRELVVQELGRRGLVVQEGRLEARCLSSSSSASCSRRRRCRPEPRRAARTCRARPG